MELMEICTKMSLTRGLSLENVKTAQDLESTSLKKRVKKLEKKKKARTPQLKRRLFKVRIESSADKSLGDQEDASKQGRNIAESDQDEEISFVQEDAKTQGRYDQDIDVTTVSSPITKLTAGVSVYTYSLYTQLSQITPPTRTTTVIEDKDLTIAQTLMKMRNGVTMQEPSDSNKQEHKQYSFTNMILKDKGKAKMIEPKKPSKKKDQIKFDEEVQKTTCRENYRADGSTKFYKIFSAMLDDFDRQDVLDLYRLIKERFETTSLEGYDRLLWGDLITLFEPSEEDEI
ncbi:hypothetical protein Tco_1576261 [Tanacetum coccineum]